MVNASELWAKPYTGKVPMGIGLCYSVNWGMSIIVHLFIFAFRETVTVFTVIDISPESA